jgi:phage-related protein
MVDLVNAAKVNLNNLGKGLSGGGKGSGGGSLISNPLAGISNDAIQSVADSLSNITVESFTPNLDPVQQAVETVTAPAVKAVEQVAKPVEQAVKPVTAPVVKAVEEVAKPVVKAVEQVAKPVEQVAQTAVQAVTPVVESVVDVAKVPVQAVEQITKIDAPKVVESVVKETILAPVKAAETVVKAAEPVVKAATQVVQQPVKAVEEIAKIDVPKVAETVVKQAAQVPIKTVETAAQIGLSVAKPVMDLTKIDYARDFNELLDNANELVGTTLLETGKALEGIPATLSALSPYGSAGSGSGGGGAQLDANTPNLGDDQVFSDLETATGKGSQMSEEERLRRIRRLLTNRYGREKTILGGAGDTTSRRRYAV